MLEDRATIIEALRVYAEGVDARDWEQVRPLFTEDATLDYSSVGGPVGPRDEVLGWLAEMLAPIACTQHLLTNHDVVVDGDEARSRVLMFNPFVVATDGNEAAVALFGGHYEDRWVRREDGWSITDRIHVLTWRAGPVPGAIVTDPARTAQGGPAPAGA